MRFSIPDGLPDSLDSEPTALLSHLAPDFAAALFGLGRAPYDHTTLTLREFEAARIRTAEINGCEMCRGFRAARDLPALPGGDPGGLLARGAVPDEAFYADILGWRESSAYGERERIAIELAERMGLDPGPLGYDQAFWERAKAHFTDAEIVELTICISAWMANGRVLHVLGLDTVCVVPTAVPVNT